MKKIQESKVGMIKLVTTTFNEAPVEVIAAIPGIAPKIVTLNGNVVLIEDNIEIQGSNRKGTALEKRKRRDVLEVDTNYLSTKGGSFAYDTNDLPLRVRVEIAPSALAGLPSLPFVGKCKDIHDALFPHLADLVPYGITAVTLAAQLAKVDSFNSYINMPRTTYEERKQATAKIPVLIADCDDIFEGTDRSVRGLKTTFPEFYTKYFNDREIYNIGGRVLAVRGNITTVEGLPLKGVKIQFVGSDIVKKSTDKGNWQVHHLAPGVWEVILTKAGYRKVVRTVAVTRDERSELVVVMDLEMVEV